MTYTLRVAASALALCLSTPVWAQIGPRPGLGEAGQGDNVTVGLGVGVTTSYDGADDYRLIPGGTLRGNVDGHEFQLNGLQIYVNAVPSGPSRTVEYEFGPVAGVRLNRTGSVSDARVEALGERDVAVELGARGSVGKRGILSRSDKLALSVTAIQDVAGAHGSHIISPSIEYSRPVTRRTFLRAALTADMVGGDYADYYFGVSPEAAQLSGLAEFKANGGLASIGTTMLATHSLGQSRKGWALFGIVSFKRLQGDLADSPIVTETGSPNQFFGSFGLGYTF